MTTEKPLKVKLSSEQSLAFAPSADNAKRTFSGVANSGKPFGYGAYQMVVDFDNIKIKPKTAVLLEHNPHKAAGVATLSVANGVLYANGTLMDNEHGRYIAELSDNDFPWEMSVHVEAARYEEVSAGKTVVVNGNEITAPVVIMRDCAIREVSFTPVGVDSQTSAVVLSDNSPVTFQFSATNEKGNTMTDEEKQKMADLEKQVSDLKAENAELKKAQKKDNVKAKLSAAGFKTNEQGGFDGVSAPMMSALLSASEADVDAMIADLKLSASPQKPPIPPELTQGLGGGVPEETVKLSAAAQCVNAAGKAYV